MVWNYEIENNSDYLDKRFVYREFEPEEIEEALNSLDGNILQDGESGSKEHFYITFLGVLLSEEGNDYLLFLAEVLKYVKIIFLSGSSKNSINWDELEKELHLKPDKKKLYTKLIMKSPFFFSPTTAETAWAMALPKETYKFKSIKDFPAYITEVAMRNYDPQLPTNMFERLKYEHSKNAFQQDLGESTPQKELEQKFKILWSPKQAELDFQEYMAMANQWENPIALLFMDIDNFKALNTRFTETTVDQTILTDSQKLLKKLVQSRGGAYRQGGEEFVVIMPNLESSEAKLFAEKIRENFENKSFQVAGNVVHITVSIGVALWPKNGSTYQEVLEAANKAERKAKERRNTIRIFAQE